MRSFFMMALLLTSTGAAARPAIFGPAAHYYGPLKIFYGVGFDEKIEKDGSVRVMASSRRIDGKDFARSMALYRAAEIADTGGHRYLQVLGGRITRGVGLANFGTETAILYARAVDSDAAPAVCRQAAPQPGNCVTISVAQIRTVAGAALGLAAPLVPGFAAAADETAVPAPPPILAHLPMPSQ